MQEVSLKNIFADQKVAATFLDKVLDRDYSLNGPKYRDINPKDFFDLNNKYSKFSYDEKLSILKYHLKSKSFYSLWSPGKVLYENNPSLFDDPKKQKVAYDMAIQAFIDQRTEIDKIIDSLPDEYHDELDTFYTELTCHSLGVLLAYDRESLFYEVFLKYLESQLKLSEEQNWPAEKKAVIQKWIAYCEEKIKPSQEFLDKKAKNGKFVDLYSYFLKDEKPLDLAQLEGILNAKFHDRSVVVKKSFFDTFFNPFKPIKKMVEDGEIEAKDQNNYEDIDYKAANLVIKKFCFDGVISSTEMSRDLYLGEGPFKYVPLENRLEIAAMTPFFKTLADWYKFISSIESDKRNPEMDAALLTSLPKEEFNYNLYDVLDCIIGEKEIKIQVSLQPEEDYDDEEKSSLDTEANTEDQIIDEADEEKEAENDVRYESYKKTNSDYKPAPAPKKKEKELIWFFRVFLYILSKLGVRVFLGLDTSTYKKAAPATSAHKNIKRIAAGNKKKKLTPVHNNTHTKPKNIDQDKSIIPKSMSSNSKNIFSL